MFAFFVHSTSSFHIMSAFNLILLKSSNKIKVTAARKTFSRPHITHSCRINSLKHTHSHIILYTESQTSFPKNAIKICHKQFSNFNYIHVVGVGERVKKFLHLIEFRLQVLEICSIYWNPQKVISLFSLDIKSHYGWYYEGNCNVFRADL